MMFKDRNEAGRRLARMLSIQRTKIPAPLVVALPRGGLPVAAEIARQLHAPLDVLVVCKLGAPDNPEYGIGAVTEGGNAWIDDESVQALRIEQQDIQSLLIKERAQAKRRAQVFRRIRPRSDWRDRNIILVDDGLATGGSAMAAIVELRESGARSIHLAVPVGAPDSLENLRKHVDGIYFLEAPDRFHSVGAWYEDFGQLTDEDALAILEQHEISAHTQEIQLELAAHITLQGSLSLPSHAQGFVIFAHGSGSSRLSPRNQSVAAGLRERGLGTLLFDLLTESESQDPRLVFDIPFLAERLAEATRWAQTDPRTRNLPLGYFGASTGAGAALHAAADASLGISAIVSRGGRPDLTPKLREVAAPVLLLVGERDREVMKLNRSALHELRRGELRIIAGATHLFEEPGALEQVTLHAAQWFEQRFAPLWGTGGSKKKPAA